MKFHLLDCKRTMLSTECIPHQAFPPRHQQGRIGSSSKGFAGNYLNDACSCGTRYSSSQQELVSWLMNYSTKISATTVFAVIIQRVGIFGGRGVTFK